MEDSQKVINKTLAMAGLATTEHPRQLLQQISYLIKDHDDFRVLLSKVEPHKRTDCYESLRALLSFQVKPLDVYIADAKQQAERLKLPEWDNATKEVADHGTHAMQQAASKAIANAAREAKFGVLEMTCRRCTSVQTFRATTRGKAIRKAIDVGWRKDVQGKDRKYLCPSCSGSHKAVIQ